MGFQREYVGSVSQRGAALVISLVFLVVMTLVGVTVMNTTTLQERMAGNTADRSIAFQAAESALREGEDWLRINSIQTFAREPLATPQAWDGSGADGVVSGLDARLAADPAFHGGPPHQVRIGIGLGSGDERQRCFHEVTARGVGGTENAVVVLRSRFEPEPFC